MGHDSERRQRQSDKILCMCAEVQKVCEGSTRFILPHGRTTSVLEVLHKMPFCVGKGDEIGVAYSWATAKCGDMVTILRTLVESADHSSNLCLEGVQGGTDRGPWCVTKQPLWRAPRSLLASPVRSLHQFLKGCSLVTLLRKGGAVEIS